MNGWSDYLVKKALDRQWGATDTASPSLYFALFTVLPDDTGANGTEVDPDLSGYTRKQVTNNGSEWPDSVSGSGTKSNANAITFDTPGDPWGTVVGLGVYDAQGTLFDPFTVNTGTDVITQAGHGYSDGDVLLLTTSGVIPGGLLANTPLYVRDKTTDTFKLALTAGGAAIDITTSGSGTHQSRKVGNLLAVASVTPTIIATGVPLSLPAGSVTIGLTGPSNYTNRKMLDYWFGGQSWTIPATVYFAAFTTAPDADGAGGVEPSGNAYVRKSITNNTSNFPDSTLGSGVKTNAIVTFATPTPSGWGTVKAIGVYDASTGGNLLWYAEISDTVVAASDPLVIAAGDLRIKLN